MFSSGSSAVTDISIFLDRKNTFKIILSLAFLFSHMHKEKGKSITLLESYFNKEIESFIALKL